MAESQSTTLAAPRQAVRLRPATFDDYSEVAALQVRNGLTTRTREDWAALWKENPAYLGAERKAPIGWVLESEDENVVGFLGNLPLRYRFQGRDIAAATAYSWVVDQSYRGHSVMLLDTFRRQPSVDLLIFTTVNAAAEAVLRAFGLKRVPVGEWDVARFWITDYPRFAAGALAARRLPMVPTLAPLVAAGLWVKGFAHDRSLARQIERIGDVEIRVQPEFDERFTSFWADLERDQRDRLLAIRDLETLTWHYRSSTRRDTTWIVTAERSGQLVAYWVVDRQDHPSLGLKRLRFVDFQALPGNESLLLKAVHWSLELCRKDRLHVAEDLGSWIRQFQIPGTVGPFRRRMKSWLFYYMARNPELAEALKQPGVWAPSSFDGDASL